MVVVKDSRMNGPDCVNSSVIVPWRPASWLQCTDRTRSCSSGPVRQHGRQGMCSGLDTSPHSVPGYLAAEWKSGYTSQLTLCYIYRTTPSIWIGYWLGLEVQVQVCVFRASTKQAFTPHADQDAYLSESHLPAFDPFSPKHFLSNVY